MKQSQLATLSSIAIAFIGGALITHTPSAAVEASTPTEQPIIKTFAVEYPENPTRTQKQLLGLAYDIAKRDGHEHPELLQGIILQESHAGELKRYKVVGQEYDLGPTKRYYGIAQIKLSAAWSVLKKWPSMWTEFHFHTRTDDEIIAKLIEDDVFNMSVASKYLLLMKSFGYTTPEEMAMAYNKGPGGARGHDASTNEYATAVMVKADL